MDGPSRISAVELLGVRVHPMTLQEAVDAVLGLVRAGGAHQIVTLNGPMLAQVSADSALREIINAASLVTADGAGVLLVGRILGCRLPARVAGIDLVDRVCAAGAGTLLRVFLLGAQPGVAADAADAIRFRHPGVEVVGTHHGYFPEEDDAAVTARIRESKPNVLLVAMGFPRQERWIAGHLSRLGPVICVGVGGTFDVLAGRVRLAPDWMRRAGLEWVYRLVREPRRWRAAVALPRLLWLAVKERLFGGKS